MIVITDPHFPGQRFATDNSCKLIQSKPALTMLWVGYLLVKYDAMQGHDTELFNVPAQVGQLSGPAFSE